MRLILILLTTFTSCISLAQTISIKQANDKLLGIFKENEPRAEVLLLGTFHFAYPDKDGYKTPDSLRVDMLTEQRQKEIAEVIAMLKRFNPTRIAIEVVPEKQERYDSLFRKYLSGQLANERSEKFQLGFKLAKQLGHQKVYCIDAKPFVKTLAEVDSSLDRKYSLEEDSLFVSLASKYEAFYNYDDTLQRDMSLKDYLLLINSEKYLRLDNEQYLTYTRKGTALEPTGADGFISKWFNRNARIFSNIQRLAVNKKERILVIFGGGHIPMLQFLAASSQEFTLRQLIEFAK